MMILLSFIDDFLYSLKGTNYWCITAQNYNFKHNLYITAEWAIPNDFQTNLHTCTCTHVMNVKNMAMPKAQTSIDFSIQIFF